MTDTGNTENVENEDTAGTAPNAYHLSITPRCDIPLSALEGLSGLLEILLPHAQIPHLEHLTGVLVIADGHMNETIQELIQQDIADDATRTVMPSSATATAVPVVTHEGLRCFVVLEESLIRPLTPEDCLHWNAISTVLEELLHIRHYSGLADILFAPDNPGRVNGADAPLSLCFKTLSEYMVNRWKARLASTLPLYAVPGGFSPIILAYPHALGPKLDDAGTRIIEIVIGVADQRIPFEQGWQQMMQTTLCGVFEPLARERAYRDGNGEGVETPVPQPDASQSWFYTRHVAPYWATWYQALQQAFDTFETDPQATVEALASMRTTLLAFLDHMGVEYEQLPDGRSHVMFYGWTALALKEDASE